MPPPRYDVSLDGMRERLMGEQTRWLRMKVWSWRWAELELTAETLRYDMSKDEDNLLTWFVPQPD